MADPTSRMLKLLSLLQTHRHWAGPELADRLAVSERTLRRDVDRLRELGYPVDATRGLRDFSDDLLALLDTLQVGRVHLFGWSMGGGVVAQATIDAPQRVASLTLQAPLSPYGFGGTDQHGRLVFADGAGSGAGGVNPRFVELIAAGDGDGVPGADGAPESTSPRATVRGLYVAPRAQPWCLVPRFANTHT